MSDICDDVEEITMQICLMESITPIKPPLKSLEEELEHFQIKRKMEAREIWEKAKSNYQRQYHIYKQPMLRAQSFTGQEAPFLDYLTKTYIKNIVYKKCILMQNEFGFYEERMPRKEFVEIWKFRLVCKQWCIVIYECLKEENIHPQKGACDTWNNFVNLYDDEDIPSTKWKYYPRTKHPVL